MDKDQLFEMAKNARRYSIHPRSSVFLSPEEIANSLNVNQVPDKLLLRIFAYLSHKELCVIAVVCKKWRNLAYDPILWQSLNLRPDYGGLDIRSNEKLINLINVRCAILRYIELSSDLITVPVLEELANKCPNLRYMTLDFSNAMQLHDFNELMSFPASLYYLSICLSDVIFMEGLMRKIYQCLSSIEVLHLIGTFELSKEEEEEIYEVINVSKIKTHTPNLRVVNFFGVSFVDDAHVELLANNCIHLECIAVNFCLKVKGSALKVLLAKCTKITSLLMQHCGLEDEHMMAVEWENSNIEELDITSTELSAECLENFLSRIPSFTYLGAGFCDFFNDKVLERLMELGKFERIRAINLSYTPTLTEMAVNRFLIKYGHRLHGLMLQGKPILAEYFWANVIPYLKDIRVCVLGTADGWFFKLNTRVHIDQILEGFAQNCPNLEALEIQWDPDTIRFSDKSRKFIDHIRLKCWRLKSFTLSDGKYYEMVKSNFERSERPQVIRTCTTYKTSIVCLLRNFKDLLFN